MQQQTANWTKQNSSRMGSALWLRFFSFALITSVCLSLLVACGCSRFNNEPEKIKPGGLANVFGKKESSSDLNAILKDSTPNEKSVRTSGGLTLGDTDNLAFSESELAELLDSLLTEKKINSVRGLIRLYPDLVTKLLISSGSSQLSKSRQLEVAGLFDQQWSGNGQDTWQSYVKAVTDARSSVEFVTARSEFLSRLSNNQPKKALELKIRERANKTDSLIADAEALRLEGMAYMMLEQHENSSDRFQVAMQLLSESHPYQASKIGLLLGESQRHAGDLAKWKENWETAIELQSRWLAERGLTDPSFWKKAAFLRPVSTPWPNQVVGRLEKSLQKENLHFPSTQPGDKEAVIWATIGIQSLKRHESQNAILSFKKCEALVDDKSLKQELQMQQALALIDSGQQGPASAILLRLGSTQSLVGDRSKAILATLKLQNGSLAQGMNLLQSAIKTSNQWPAQERMRAQADYALAYLMRGKEEQGINLLNSVHGEFVKHQNFEHAAQCLTNMAAYYEKTDQGRKQRETLARLDSLETL